MHGISGSKSNASSGSSPYTYSNTPSAAPNYTSATAKFANASKSGKDTSMYQYPSSTAHPNAYQTSSALSNSSPNSYPMSQSTHIQQPSYQRTFSNDFSGGTEKQRRLHTLYTERSTTNPQQQIFTVGGYALNNSSQFSSDYSSLYHSNTLSNHAISGVSGSSGYSTPGISAQGDPTNTYASLASNLTATNAALSSLSAGLQSSGLAGLTSINTNLSSLNNSLKNNRTPTLLAASIGYTSRALAHVYFRTRSCTFHARCLGKRRASHAFRSRWTFCLQCASRS